MIFIDSNIPMYLVGSDHLNKALAAQMLEQAVRDEFRLVTNVEVIQEILHRYVAIDRLDAIAPAIDLLLAVVDEVFDITLADGLRARVIVMANRGLSARDALHIAVIERNEIDRIMSFDADFDRWPGLLRLRTTDS